MAKFLVVDDQPHITLLIANWLRRQNHEVTRAKDGKNALDLLSLHPFDVLITDVGMPNLDGLRLVQSVPPSCSLRAIFVITGRSDYEELDPTCGDRYVECLPKPFSPTKMVERIAHVLKERRIGCA